MTFSSLRALHAEIGKAIEEIEQVYRDQSEGTPLEYPALDVPYYSTLQHSPETDKAEQLRIDPTVFGASNRIVAACGQLSATVNKPFYSVIEGMYGINVTASLQFLEATHTVEILREAGPEGLHVKDIARKATELRRAKNPAAIDIDPSRYSHVLRLLATYHWLREVKPDVFANNRLSSHIDSGKSTEFLCSTPETKYEESNGVAAYLATATDEVFKLMTVLTEWLLNDGGSKWESAFNMRFQTPLKYYEWIEQPGNEYRVPRFGNAMTGTQQFEVAENIIHSFPWAELPQDSVVVDVGGGIGSASVLLAQAHPHLRYVVEDRAGVVAVAPQVWGSKHAELFSTGRISFQARNFFDERTPNDVPGVGAVAHPDVYLLRIIAHNWGDDQARQMLIPLRKGAGPNTKLLWVDMLLPYAAVDDESGKDAAGSLGAIRSLVPDGSPLLPNLGRGSSNGYLLDLTMLGRFDAKERTFREADELARSAGWKITRVNRVVGSLMSYITAEPL